jgi:hypothetical protein
MRANTLDRHLTDSEVGPSRPVASTATQESRPEYLLKNFEWAVRQIEPLFKLPSGWDGYGAERTDARLASFAIHYLAFLKGKYKVSSPIVSPTVCGGVNLEWDIDNKCLEIEIDSMAGGFYIYKDAANNVRRNGLVQVNAPIEQKLHMALTLCFPHGDFD